MGTGKKFALYGFGGFMALSAVAAVIGPPEISSKDRLKFGKTYFADRCSSITRNRKINGRFGRGHLYCKCMNRSLAARLRTPDEFRFAAKLHSAVGTERAVFAKARMKASMRSVERKYSKKISRGRLNQVKQIMFQDALRCTRSV